MDTSGQNRRRIVKLWRKSAYFALNQDFLQETRKRLFGSIGYPIPETIYNDLSEIVDILYIGIVRQNKGRQTAYGRRLLNLMFVKKHSDLELKLWLESSDHFVAADCRRYLQLMQKNNSNIKNILKFIRFSAITSVLTIAISIGIKGYIEDRYKTM